MTHDTSRPDGIYDFDYEPAPDRLSPSGAKKLLQPAGPARFDDDRTRPKKPESKFDMGKLVHRFVLGAGDEVAPIIGRDKKTGELIEYANYNTNDAKAIRDKAYADGLIPAFQWQIDQAIKMAGIVHEHPHAGPLISAGEPEKWLYATEPETGQRIRLRPDCRTPEDGRLWISEFKTTGEKADRDGFGRTAYNLKYYLQFVFAVVAARALGLDENPAFVFIVQETDSPYLVNMHEMDADYFHGAYDEMRQAIAIFQRCNTNNTWPGYGTGINSMRPPPYAFRKPTIADLIGADQ